MVYKAITGFLSEKASAFLPGKTFYPEEDRYASQFDPSSAGIRPIVRPWFNISIQIQIGGTAPGTPPTYEQPLPQPFAAHSAYAEPQSYAPAERPIPRGGGRQQAAIERVTGNGYGNSTVQGHGVAHFGDVNNYYSFQAQTLRRRNSSPSVIVQRGMSFEAFSRSAKQVENAGLERPGFSEGHSSPVREHFGRENGR